MSNSQPDTLCVEPVKIPRWAWRAAVVVLVAGLAVSVVVAIGYRDQAAALRRQLQHAHAVAGSPPASQAGPATSGLTVYSASVALLSPGPLAGRVTVIAASSSGLRADVLVIGRISGGRPYTRYTLTGGPCSATRLRRWAAGVTDAHGNADLSGPAQQVSAASTYWLELTPGVKNHHPSLQGDFAVASGITAYPDPVECN